jgi:predicted DCC family thiol-disulfide oxidoreductase YuxK
MNASQVLQMQMHAKPILLFDDECGVCRRIAHWVQSSARDKSAESSIIVEPIGVDPEALRSLNPELDIWDAYATIHVLMPDGSMKLGGEAVAEVLRNLAVARWFSWSFTASLFGFRPFQMILNLAYAILADVRPLLGCESCGTPRPWLRPIVWLTKWATGTFSRTRHPILTPHFTSVSAVGRRPLTALGRSSQSIR